jgi:hypothetical protein
MTLPSMEDLLNKVGGGKYVAWDTVEIGATIGGIITEPGRSEQQTNQDKSPAFFDDGQPKMQIVIPIQCAPEPGLAGDNGLRQLAFRGGFTYESGFKGLVNELRRNKIDEPRVGDYVSMTRLANRKGKGMTGRTHQFGVKYVKAEDFEAEGIKPDALPVPASGGAEDPWG